MEIYLWGGIVYIFLPRESGWFYIKATHINGEIVESGGPIDEGIKKLHLENILNDGGRTLLGTSRRSYNQI